MILIKKLILIIIIFILLFILNYNNDYMINMKIFTNNIMNTSENTSNELNLINNIDNCLLKPTNHVFYKCINNLDIKKPIPTRKYKKIKNPNYLINKDTKDLELTII